MTLTAIKGDFKWRTVGCDLQHRAGCSETGVASAAMAFWRTGKDLSPWRPAQTCKFTGEVFLTDEILVAASFSAARSRLARLAESSELLRSSQGAYDHGIELTARVGTASVSKLVQVQAAQLAQSAGTGLAVRWHATGAGSSLFPALDADITLTPAGEQLTVLSLTGTYRPPLGPVGEALDRAILRRVAAATIRNFISRLAVAITDIDGPAQAERARASPPHDPPDAR